jgi:hypothetical protein
MCVTNNEPAQSSTKWPVPEAVELDLVEKLPADEGKPHTMRSESTRLHPSRMLIHVLARRAGRHALLELGQRLCIPMKRNECLEQEYIQQYVSL